MMTRGMMFHKLLFSLVFLFVCMSGNAQTDYTAEELAKTTNWVYRLGKNKRDSTEADNWARKFYNAFYVNVRKTNSIEDYRACYRPWKQLMELAPYSFHSLTNTGGGILILSKLMENETDSVLRYVYFKDVIRTDNFRIQNYKKLNAIPKDGGEKRIPLSLGSALMWKAVHYHDLGTKYISRSVYRPDSAYQYFVKAFEQIGKENVGEVNEIDAYYLEEYFKSCVELYELDEKKYMEQFLTDYTTCLDACNKMMNVYGKKPDTGLYVDSIKWKNYAGRYNNIQYYFSQTSAGNKENIIKYFEPRIKENRKNYDYLKNAVHLMTTNGCIGTDVYYDACEASYMIKPDFENCIGMGLLSKNDGDRTTAMQNFEEAFAKASNAGQRYFATRWKAEAIASAKNPADDPLYAGREKSEILKLQETWRGEQQAAGICFNQALQYAQDAAIPGQDLAEIYYKMSDCFRKARSFDEANNSLHFVSIYYPNYDAGKIKKMQEAIDNNKKAYEHNLLVQQEKLNNDKKRAAWEAEQRRLAEEKRKEAEFWTKK